MIFSTECYTCIIRQAQSAAQASSATPETEDRVLRTALRLLLERSPDQDVPDVHNLLWPELAALSGAGDPFAPARESATRQALGWLADLRAELASAADPFFTAVKLAVAGNIIDAAVGIPGDIRAELHKVMGQPFVLDDFAALREAVKSARSILYLCDNAGETVFDRLLIEQLGPNITCVVKGGPILNDALMADALDAGLDQVADLIDNGNDGLGTQLTRAGDDLLVAWKEADLIISKGMGNFETLHQLKEPRLFFLMKIKCAPISRATGAPEGSIVVANGARFPA